MFISLSERNKEEEDDDKEDAYEDKIDKELEGYDKFEGSRITQEDKVFVRGMGVRGFRNRSFLDEHEGATYL